jgi:tRNA threonylcarbamoyladenosine biosynthesis protein TsaB
MCGLRLRQPQAIHPQRARASRTTVSLSAQDLSSEQLKAHFADGSESNASNPRRRFVGRSCAAMIPFMSRALAIETSGQTGSVALVDGGIVVEERQFAHGLKHAAGLVPLIDLACRARGWTPRDLDELYVSCGPGSFTGLRIGVTLAKTFALATAARLVAVPTLDVLAHNAPAEARNLIVLLDAKRGQVFTARYTRRSADAAWSALEPARLDCLTNMIARAPRPVYLLGAGIAFHLPSIPVDPQVIVTAADLWRGRASVVARLGMQLAAAGQYTDPYQFTPTYIRPPEAEEKYLAVHPSSPVDLT